MKVANLLRATAFAVFPMVVFVGVAWVLPRVLAPRVPLPVESRLRSSGVAEPTARWLARYCQSERTLFPRVLDYAWLPEELNRVRHGVVVELKPDGARVEFGGGSHRFGYELQREGVVSGGTTNRWRLEFRGVDGEAEVLFRWESAARETVDAGTLLTNVTSAYTRQLQAFPGDEAAHRGRIRTYLWFDRPAKARQACREMLRNLPDEWWPTLVNGLIDAGERGWSVADREMEAYVARHPDFLRCLDLAYFHELQGQPGRAAQAVRRAMAYDANVPAGHGGDSEYRGFHAAMYLYRSGHYELAADLCRQLQAVWINGDFAKASLRKLQAAAERAARGEVVSMDWPTGMPPFYPFEDLDLVKLLGRPVVRPGRGT